MFQILLIKSDTGLPLVNKKISTSLNGIFGGKSYYTNSSGIAQIPESNEVLSLYTEIDGSYCELYHGIFKGYIELHI